MSGTTQQPVGQSNPLTHMVGDQKSACKTFSTMAALYALAGWQLWRTDATDGPQRFFAARWGQVTAPMADLIEAEQFLAQVTGVKR